METELLLGAILLVSLIAYVVTGGADFGGGVWEMFAQSDDEHHAIKDALAPIWEANHVWLILIVVLLFVCFPLAFATISIALHIPLVLMLIGIVLRGAAFAFRSYAAGDVMVERNSVRVFAASSIVTPIFLGVCGGTVAAGELRLVDGTVQTNFLEWLAPFPFAVGFLMLALCAWLAAIYMCVETLDHPELLALFRRRAIGSTAAVAVMAVVTAALATTTDSPLGQWFSGGGSIALLLAAGGAWALTGIALRRAQYRLARASAPTFAAALIAGWGVGQYPLLVPPHIAFDSVAPESVTTPVLIVLGLGTCVLIPAFIWLYRVFKTA